MTGWLAVFLVLVGAVFSLIAAVGIVRMPDFYARMQATTKAVTLGVGCVVLAAVLQLEGPGAKTRALLVGAFLTLTAPIAAQTISRAAYAENVPLWEGTIVDELEVNAPGAAKITEGAPGERGQE